MAMSEADIQCELSYAYLHAVAARMGVECEKTERISDNHAVDARLHVFGKLAPDFGLARLSVDVQLKSCSREMTQNSVRFSYPIERSQYDKLRETHSNSPLLLVLFVLPPNSEEWISLDEESLVARKCAYWVSLYGAEPVSVDKPTVYVPKANLVSIDGMRTLLGRFSRREEVRYVG